MTLKDFRGILDHCGDLGEDIPDHAHTNQRQHRQAHLRRADLSVVAHDDASVLELANTLDDGWGREADAARKLGEAKAAMLLQMVEQLAVDGVEVEFTL